LPLGLREAVRDDPEHERIEAQPEVAARHADVLVQCRIAVDRRLLRRHDAVGQRIDARDRHRQRLWPAQVLGTQMRHVRRGSHRVRDQPVERLHERRRLAAGAIERHRAAKRDHRADALRRLVGAVHGEHAAEAPADEAHLAATLVVQVANLLLQRTRAPAAETDVAPEAPGLHFVAAVLQEQLEHDQRRLVRHESRQQQHRVAVAARRPGEDGQVPRQRSHLEQGARLDQLVPQQRLADVCLSRGHRAVGLAERASGQRNAPRSAQPTKCRMPQATVCIAANGRRDIDRRQALRFEQHGRYASSGAQG